MKRFWIICPFDQSAAKPTIGQVEVVDTQAGAEQRARMRMRGAAEAEALAARGPAQLPLPFEDMQIEAAKIGHTLPPYVVFEAIGFAAYEEPKPPVAWSETE